MEYFDYTGQVSCIDRQIAELEARKDALLNGYCFTGYYGMVAKPYLDPYGIDVEEGNDGKDSFLKLYKHTLHQNKKMYIIVVNHVQVLL